MINAPQYMAVILTTKIFAVCPKKLGRIAGPALTIDMVVDSAFGQTIWHVDLIAHQSKSGQRFIFNSLLKSN